MSFSKTKIVAVEGIGLGVLVLLLLGSVAWWLLPHDSKVLVEEAVSTSAVVPPVVLPDLNSRPIKKARSQQEHRLFSGELRVLAIGSAYPIPYAAEVCPFTGMRQPAINQLDRDGDGITDDWEDKYGLNKYDAADAKTDLDGDGFIQLEEFQEGTDPTDRDAHPAYALKLRFVKRHEVPFPLIFQGVSRFPDGRIIFQVNILHDGSSHFLSLGEEVEGIELWQYLPAEGGGDERLVVRRGDVEIALPRAEKVVDPESRVELINILDRSIEIVTMDALLSLRNDVYTVLSVHPDKVVVRHLDSGNVYDVVGLTEEE